MLSDVPTNSGGAFKQFPCNRLRHYAVSDHFAEPASGPIKLVIAAVPMPRTLNNLQDASDALLDSLD
jgi:hypothetical protein